MIRILGNTYVGVKKNISLVEIPGAVLVLGITSENISLLSKIEDSETLKKLKCLENGEGHPSFSEQIKKVSTRFKVTRNISS